MAIANLLREIEKYSSEHGFDNNNAYYAKKIANGFENGLLVFLNETADHKTGSVPYETKLQDFNSTCTEVIRENLKGVSRESTFWNFIAPLVNGFLKLIGVEPYKLHTTHFAKNSVINAGLNSVKLANIAKEDISKIQAENENDKEDRLSP